MSWNNDQLEKSVIISRRPAGPNEFIFSFDTSIHSIGPLLKYIESISDIKIQIIEREELPMHQGIIGWRVIKDE